MKLNSRFGKLVVCDIKQVGRRSFAFCNCDCGARNFRIRTDQLKKRSLPNCGCIKQEKRIWRTCCADGCNKKFYVLKKRADIGRGLFCSQKCHYNNRHKILPPLTDEQMQLIVGSMLGDASLHIMKKESHNSYFEKSQSLSNKEYINWHHEILKNYSRGVTCRKNGKEYISRIMSHCHPVFKELRNKWYPNGHKIIPDDIKLTPLILAIWFCDDGCNAKAGAKRSACFATHCFTYEDVKRLSDIITNKFGINTYINLTRKTQPVLKITAEHYLKFIELIRPYVIWRCLQYKVDISNYDHSKKTYRRLQTHEFISPSGQKYKTDNLPKFCLEHKLIRSKMQLVSNGGQSNHKGWQATTHYNPSIKAIHQPNELWRFISPDGKIYEFYNLNKFCREHNLRTEKMCDVYKKRRKSHKGWKKL
jgi:hypothetical protein